MLTLFPYIVMAWAETNFLFDLLFPFIVYANFNLPLSNTTLENRWILGHEKLSVSIQKGRNLDQPSNKTRFPIQYVS
jgi:hypothetical protein